MIPDLVGMDGVVRKTSEMRRHFLARCLSNYYQPRPSLLTHTCRNVHTSMQGLVHYVTLHTWLCHELSGSLSELILE